MRKLAMLSTAMLGLAFFNPAYAQSQAAPQTGLPPGAGIGAQNAQPPRATGDLATTRTSPAVVPTAPMASQTPVPTATTRRPVRRRRIFRRRVTHPTPAPAAATPAPQ